jgi:hypothetical protein
VSVHEGLLRVVDPALKHDGAPLLTSERAVQMRRGPDANERPRHAVTARWHRTDGRAPNAVAFEAGRRLCGSQGSDRDDRAGGGGKR